MRLELEEETQLIYLRSRPAAREAQKERHLPKADVFLFGLWLQFGYFLPNPLRRKAFKLFLFFAIFCFSQIFAKSRTPTVLE